MLDQKQTQHTMTMAALIVDFPHQHNHHRAVRFADDTAQVHIVERHEDYDTENKVARHELWYTNAEYHNMRLAAREDVLEVRSNTADGSQFNYPGDDDASICCIGIEHLLTPACIREVKRCRARCVYAVFAAQARPQDLSSSETDVALASIGQTRKVALRARMLGKLHRDSSM
jgi:hypothetical protein